MQHVTSHRFKLEYLDFTLLSGASKARLASKLPDAFEGVTERNIIA